MTGSSTEASGADEAPEAAVEQEAALEAPGPAEHAQVDRVRATARGLDHERAEEALEQARAREDPAPVVEEWERIVETLTTHRGPYDPDVDPFVQGQLAGRENRARG
ncbi:hypothetical protein ACN20G_25555 [Streptomyces sp. BI20]|uniref:hypothetical protein n=1 Tax=Streptomyces sp. BI20 TaxID=3403460 RepID=UPI003C76980E